MLNGYHQKRRYYHTRRHESSRKIFVQKAQAEAFEEEVLQGINRSAKVRTVTTVKVRPVVKLAVLELQGNNDSKKKLEFKKMLLKY